MHNITYARLYTTSSVQLRFHQAMGCIKHVLLQFLHALNSNLSINSDFSVGILLGALLDVVLVQHLIHRTKAAERHL